MFYFSCEACFGPYVACVPCVKPCIKPCVSCVACVRLDCAGNRDFLCSIGNTKQVSLNATLYRMYASAFVALMPLLRLSLESYSVTVLASCLIHAQPFRPTSDDNFLIGCTRHDLTDDWSLPMPISLTAYAHFAAR